LFSGTGILKRNVVVAADTFDENNVQGCDC